MQKGSKLAAVISTGMILSGIFMFLLIHPYIYIYTGIIEENNTNIRNTKWDRLAVKYSLFKFQKNYTLENAIPGLILTKDFDTALEYLKELEANGFSDNTNKYLMSYVYMKTGDYVNALKYAKESGNKFQTARIYIKMKDIKNAEILINEFLKENPVKPNTYVYKAEIEMAKDNWKTANIYIDKMLKINPNHMEALSDKALITRKLGLAKEHKKCINKIKLLELRTEERVD